MSKQRKISIFFATLATIGAVVVWYLLKDKYVYQNEKVFWLLLLIPFYGLYHVWSVTRRYPKVPLSTLGQFGRDGSIFTEVQIHLPFLMRSVALALLIAAVARPQSLMSWQNVSSEGIDIVISTDISASMLAKDFKPDRLESSKEVAARFIRGRPNDRIGLVVYEGEAFTQCPLTTDHNVLINLLKDVRTGMIKDGTAIGMGLATAVNRLRESDAKSKVVILMTDGENNSGTISPMTAAEIAKSYGIRVYTIGVGAIGRAMSPTAIYPDGSYRYEMVDVRIDEELLKEIADLTDAAYFRATDEGVLQTIFQEIDRMEKTRVNVTEHSRRAEKFFWIAAFAAALLLIEFLYRQLIMQTLP
ncbi:MAG: VWA domain-containing protein [Cryomorphaceae bacterium]|nr:VWA domain-containing protein [Flavobacteriales bacterium]